MQGRNDGWKVEGNQGFGPNTGALAPRVLPKAGLGVGCGRGSPLPCEGPGGITPGKFLENSDAKSCIPVTTLLFSAAVQFCKGRYTNTSLWLWLWLWNFLLFENYGQEVGRPINCWSPNLYVGGPVSPGPYGCCAHGATENAGLENAGLENAAPDCRGGKRGTGKRGTRLQGWKTRE